MVVINPDHPLSLGWSLCLYTDSRFFKKKYRVSSKVIAKHVDDMRSACAIHSRFDRLRVATLAFPSYGHDNLNRLHELIIHEVSHEVDALFETACVKPCTEVRAYHMDWMCGRIFALTNNKPNKN